MTKDEFKTEIDELRARVKAAKMCPEATEKAARELKKIGWSLCLGA